MQTTTSDERLGQFTLTSKVEIAAVIRALLSDRILISIFWGDADDMFVSRVLSIDTDSGTFVVDGPKDGRTNVGIRRAKSLRFEATHRQIRIRFTCNGARAIEFDQRPGFLVTLPVTAIRVQRRSDFRARTPVLSSPTLTLNSPKAHALRSVRVTDISCGGLAFCVNAESASLQAGDLLSNCSLQLPYENEADVAIEVRHVEPFVDGVGRQMQRLGCQYRSIPHTMGALIRRYINQLEVERRPSR